MAVIALSELLVLPARPGREAVGRSCLEAVALRRPTLFPPGIEEFERCCAGSTLQRIDPETISAAIERSLRLKEVPPYDLSQNQPDQVFAQYLALYDRLVRARGR